MGGMRGVRGAGRVSQRNGWGQWGAGLQGSRAKKYTGVVEADWNNRGESNVTMSGCLGLILALLIAVCLEANCLTSL